MTKLTQPLGNIWKPCVILVRLACPAGVSKLVATMKIPVAIRARMVIILIIPNQNSTSPKILTAIKLTELRIIKKTI